VGLDWGEAIGGFLTRIIALKSVLRRGWVVKLGLEKPESVADHSYGVALVAALMARAEGLDPYRSAFLALVHDLHEVVTGDRLPGEPRSGEESAVKALASSLPSELGGLIEGAWRDYWYGLVPEARVVREADRLDMAAQALFYEGLGHSAEVLEEFWRSARRGVRSPLGLATYRALRGRRRTEKKIGKETSGG
jgi:putative hydrolase of HD superfamily